MMTSKVKAISLALGILTAALAVAQSPAPAAAPAGSTGLCKDGAYWQGPTKQGACRGHHGVKDWYGVSAAPAAATPSSPSNPVTASLPSAASAPTATVTSAAAAPSVKAAVPAATAAPGGAPGMVWANKSSKVYHCYNDRWYGKTKSGEYLTEADAVAQGYHPDHGKACH